MGDRPNGICFSRDKSRLYVVDIGHIRIFDMEGTTPVNGRVFVEMGPGGSDGIRTDRDGILCRQPAAAAGNLLGQIHLPEICANFCFGGVKKNRLFITAARSLYSVCHS